VFLVAIGLVVGALMTVYVVRSVAEPIAGVRDALAAVERGDLSVAVPVDDGGEIGRLQAGVNQMVEGLRERQRIADLFGRHVGDEVARQALDQEIRLGGECRQASALFVDLRDSTGLAATTPPEQVVEVLNRFFTVVVEAVSAEGGWVNKFEGDGALCVFGAPVGQPDHAARALRAARTLRTRLVDAGLSAAIGVSAGEVVAGNVGTEARYEYTVIGDPVNEAARLTEAAKDHDGATLASDAAIGLAGDEGGAWQPVVEVRLRGRTAVTRAFAPR
jgi:adenylate cyclase